MAASSVDQGFLNYLNFAAPECSVNVALASAAKQTNTIKTVPLGQECPTGYTLNRPEASSLPANTLNNICQINTPSSDQLTVMNPLADRFFACAMNRSPKTAPSLVCEYCKCPRGSGRIDPGCPPQNMACAAGCPMEFTPGRPMPEPALSLSPMMAPAPALTPLPVLTPASSPTPSPVMAPVPESSELPTWAIVLIVIAAFLVVGGLVYAGIKMSQ
jgi:hypothetical protein